TGALGLALVSVLWTYDGFVDVSFVAGEVTEPGRTLPRAIIFGTLAVVVLYVTTNVAYHYVLPVDAVARSPLVAADVMQTIFGRARNDTRDEPELRVAREHVRARRVAVLCAQRCRALPASAHASGSSAAVSRCRISDRAGAVRRRRRLVRRQRARQRSHPDDRD